jgi:hypothetical protein
VPLVFVLCLSRWRWISSAVSSWPSGDDEKGFLLMTEMLAVNGMMRRYCCCQKTAASHLLAACSRSLRSACCETQKEELKGRNNLIRLHSYLFLITEHPSYCVVVAMQ